MPNPSTELTPIVISPDEEHEWDQREGETGEQYAKFQTYLMMPREDRSILGAYKLWIERHEELMEGPQSKTVQRSETQFKSLASNQSWKDRALAYDRLVDAKVLERLANRRLDALVEMADLGQALKRAAATALKALSPVTREQGSDPETGIPVMIVKSKLSATDIAKLAQVGTELEQLALGAPTERLSLVGGQPGQGDTTTDHMASAKAELLHRIEAIRKRREAANSEEGELISTGEVSYTGEDYRVEDFEVIVRDGEENTSVADRREPTSDDSNGLDEYTPFDSQ